MNKQMTAELKILADEDELSRTSAELFARRARAAVSDHGRFTVALAGGSTPRPTYERLAADYREAVPWERTHVFWGDERPVGPDHPDSNYRMAREALLSRVPVPEENVHRMRGEDPPSEAAEVYEETLREVLAVHHVRPSADSEFNSESAETRAGRAFPRFDLILLGMGSDGHTASLFPGSDALEERTKWVTAHYVEELDTHRLTLTLPVINNAARVVFLVAGEGKAETLHRVLEGPYVPEDLPAQYVRSRDGELTWLLDESSASKLS